MLLESGNRVKKLKGPRWWLYWTKVVFPHPVVLLRIMKIPSVRCLGCVQALPGIREISIMLLLHKLCCFVLYPFLKVNKLIAEWSLPCPMSSVVNLNPRPLLLVRQTGFANMYNLKKKIYWYILKIWGMEEGIKLKKI